MLIFSRLPPSILIFVILLKNCSSSILIDNQWYDIAKMDSYDALLQELIQLKYSKDWQANHDMNMRKYAPIYQ
jgi:hypothetical protein